MLCFSSHIINKQRRRWQLLKRVLGREMYRWEFLNLDILIRFQHGFKACSKKKNDLHCQYFFEIVIVAKAEQTKFSFVNLSKHILHPHQRLWQEERRTCLCDSRVPVKYSVHICGHSHIFQSTTQTKYFW